MNYEKLHIIRACKILNRVILITEKVSCLLSLASPEEIGK